MSTIENKKKYTLSESFTRCFSLKERIKKFIIALKQLLFFKFSLAKENLKMAFKGKHTIEAYREEMVDPGPPKETASSDIPSSSAPLHKSIPKLNGVTGALQLPSQVKKSPLKHPKPAVIYLSPYLPNYIPQVKKTLHKERLFPIVEEKKEERPLVKHTAALAPSNLKKLEQFLSMHPVGAKFIKAGNIAGVAVSGVKDLTSGKTSSGGTKLWCALAATFNEGLQIVTQITNPDVYYACKVEKEGQKLGLLA